MFEYLDATVACVDGESGDVATARIAGLPHGRRDQRLRRGARRVDELARLRRRRRRIPDAVAQRSALGHRWERDSAACSTKHRTAHRAGPHVVPVVRVPGSAARGGTHRVRRQSCSPVASRPPTHRSPSSAAWHTRRSPSGDGPPGSPISILRCATARWTTSSQRQCFARRAGTGTAAACCPRRPFQAGALRGDVGELRRLLDRKRGGATFRQLMPAMWEHILAATPCVFVSPGSLAQFIPPGSVTFDLVVFDEASQVTVAQAIGALGRGRSAVIVGDSSRCRRRRSVRPRPPTRTKKTRTAHSLRKTQRASSPSASSRVSPAVAVVALPQPGRVAHQLLQSALLRGSSREPALPRRRRHRWRRMASGGRAFQP